MNVGSLTRWWATTPTSELIWVAIGFIAQFLFSMRFIVQWLATERARASVIPETFWYFSCAGGVPLVGSCHLSARPGVHRRPSDGLVIYARNIYFIRLGKRAPTPANV
jgi:lipid-A-disaccharide synthase-like uncharacterized protein